MHDHGAHSDLHTIVQRRSLLLANLLLTLSSPAIAIAATDTTVVDATTLTNALTKQRLYSPTQSISLLPPLPPNPITLPRRRLNLTFAVLLLASGYDTADALDFTPMQDFQKDFWLLRHSEWEPYTIQYSPLRITQGDLADPNYFDFIAAMQAQTVVTSMRHGLQTFREYCGEECPPSLSLASTGSGSSTVDSSSTDINAGYTMVTRDPQWQDNSYLAPRFDRILGDAIYNGLVNGFRGAQFNGPRAVVTSDTQVLVNGVKEVLQCFIDNGYCINADVRVRHGTGSGNGSSSANSNTIMTIKVDGPATLWCFQSVAFRRGDVWPVYEALAVSSFLRKSGVKEPMNAPLFTFSFTNTSVTYQFMF